MFVSTNLFHFPFYLLGPLKRKVDPTHDYRNDEERKENSGNCNGLSPEINHWEGVGDHDVRHDHRNSVVALNDDFGATKCVKVRKVRVVRDFVVVDLIVDMNVGGTLGQADAQLVVLDGTLRNIDVERYLQLVLVVWQSVDKIVSGKIIAVEPRVVPATGNRVARAQLQH